MENVKHETTSKNEGGDLIGSSNYIRFCQHLVSNFRRRGTDYRLGYDQPTDHSWGRGRVRRAFRRPQVHQVPRLSRVVATILAPVLILMGILAGAGVASADTGSTTTAPNTQSSIGGYFRSFFNPSEVSAPAGTADPVMWRDISFDKTTYLLTVVIFASFPDNVDPWIHARPLGLAVTPQLGTAIPSTCDTSIFQQQYQQAANQIGNISYKYTIDLSCLGSSPNFSTMTFDLEYQVWLDRWGTAPTDGKYNGGTVSYATFALPDYIDPGSGPLHDDTDPNKYKITADGLLNSDGTRIKAPTDDVPGADDYCITVSGKQVCGKLDESVKNDSSKVCVIKDGQQVCAPPSCTISSGLSLNSEFCDSTKLYGTCDIIGMLPRLQQLLSTVASWFNQPSPYPGYTSFHHMDPWTQCLTSLFVPQSDWKSWGDSYLKRLSSTFPLGMIPLVQTFITSVGAAVDQHGVTMNIVPVEVCLKQSPIACQSPTTPVPFLEDGSPGDSLLREMRPIITASIIVALWLGLFMRIMRQELRAALVISKKD
jgi:hypothetical protein